MQYDCSGYATVNDVLCGDGRVIKQNAFIDNDGTTVPVVWNHQRNNPENVLGHALLENRSDGVYAYVKFNNTPNGDIAKQLVNDGDINSFSIYANNLVHKGRDVIHGAIKEVSLVVAGANPGAKIDSLAVEHSDNFDGNAEEEAIITFDKEISLEVEHADENQNGSEKEVATSDTNTSNKTIKDVFETLTDEQKDAVYAMIGYALEDGAEEEDEEDVEQSDIDEEDEEDSINHSDEGDGTTMKYNVFEGANAATQHVNELSHSDIVEIFNDAKKYGSLKDSILEHGITNIDILFPEAKAINSTPDMIMRDQEWVAKVWNATRKSPFSRIKSTSANLTADEARAKGYIKGKKKIEEQFTLLKRTTTPQTVYKKQALDRDDIIDITDFDVVAWLKAEMRLMLNEELARAILVGDGRSTASEDKINEQNIRPVYTDDDMYTIHYSVPGMNSTDETAKANAIIDAAHRARKDYKGSGSPTFYTDSDTLTTLLLAKDKVGRRLYNTVSELASALRVRDIIEVPVMENQTRSVALEGNKTETRKLIGLIVNLTDYVVGADRGGAVSMFDDFDIDYNKEKYLIETRCSGALATPYSAIALEYAVTTEEDTAG